MRDLTFAGFMKKYVAELSTGHTTAIYKLVREAVTQNARLKEPLYLYAVSNGHLMTLLSASKKTALYDEYLSLSEEFTYPALLCEFEKEANQLPEEYQKVWRSFRSVKGKPQRDEQVKTMMAEKIKRLQEDRKVSTYRICRDLGLNNANVNHWLKNGCNGKVSLSTARRVLQYMDSCFVGQS